MLPECFAGRQMLDARKLLPIVQWYLIRWLLTYWVGFKKERKTDNEGLKNLVRVGDEGLKNLSANVKKKVTVMLHQTKEWFETTQNQN